MSEPDDSGIAATPSEAIATIERLLERARRGEVACFAARLYKLDGTWEDVVAGGTEEEQAEALAALQRLYAGAH